MPVSLNLRTLSTNHYLLFYLYILPTIIYQLCLYLQVELFPGILCMEFKLHIFYSPNLISFKITASRFYCSLYLYFFNSFSFHCYFIYFPSTHFMVNSLTNGKRKEQEMKDLLNFCDDVVFIHTRFSRTSIFLTITFLGIFIRHSFFFFFSFASCRHVSF